MPLDEEDIQGLPPRGTKTYMLIEEDLVTLERVIPEFMDALALKLDPRLRTQFRQVKDILSNVRWGYGPWDKVEVVGPPETN